MAEPSGKQQSARPRAQPWTAADDQRLAELVARVGEEEWQLVASAITGRSARQCRERYKNHVKEGINRGPWTEGEDALVVAAQARLGNKWTEISRLLGGPPWRTDNAIKNRWNTHLNPRNAALGDKDGAAASSYSSDSASATRSVSPALSTASSSWATSVASETGDEHESRSSPRQHALLRSTLSKLLDPESSASLHAPSTPASIPPSPTPARMEVRVSQAASFLAHSPAQKSAPVPYTAGGTSGVVSVIMRVQEQNRRIQQLQQQHLQQQQELMRTLRERQHAQDPTPAAGPASGAGEDASPPYPDAATDTHSYPLVQFPEPPRDFGLGSPMECCTPEARSPQMNPCQSPQTLAGQLLRSPLHRPSGGIDTQDDMWDELDELPEQQHCSNSERAEEQRRMEEQLLEQERLHEQELLQEQMAMMQKIEQTQREKILAGGGAAVMLGSAAQPDYGKQQSGRGVAGEAFGWPVSPREQQSLTIKPKNQPASGTSTSKSAFFCCISPPLGIMEDDDRSGASSSKTPGDQAGRFVRGGWARRKGVHQWATADAAEMESLSTPLMIIAGQDFSCEEAADREMSENQDGFFAVD